MINLLHMMGYADIGGISAVVVNYMEHINRDQIHFDFSLTGGEPGPDGKKLMDMGAHFFRLPLMHNGPLRSCIAAYKLFKKNSYDIVHIHGSIHSFLLLWAARLAGVKKRILHVHSTLLNPSLLKRIEIAICRFFIFHSANLIIACGKKAGESTLGEKIMKSQKAILLPNAIDTKKYRFDPSVREEIRRQLGLDDCFVIGFVGRLSYEKNILFILDVIKEVYQSNNNIRFVIAGSGEDQEVVKERIRDNNMDSYVICLGARLDVERLYQGFDCLVLPSLYEGFPVVAVEALSSGLPILLSDRITDELRFASSVEYLPLVKEEWVNALKQKSNMYETGLRLTRQNEVVKAGYDIHDTSLILERIYKA